jgi:hypothetical protein
MARTPKYTQQQMIDAIRATKGMVYLTAQRLGCDVKTVYNYRDRYATVRAEMELQDGLVDDTAELKLMQAITKGEAWAIQFRLRTKGKNRGYVDRTEITGADGDAIRFTADDAIKAKRELSEWQEKKSSG